MDDAPLLAIPTEQPSVTTAESSPDVVGFGYSQRSDGSRQMLVVRTGEGGGFTIVPDLSPVPVGPADGWIAHRVSFGSSARVLVALLSAGGAAMGAAMGAAWVAQSSAKTAPLVAMSTPAVQSSVAPSSEARDGLTPRNETEIPEIAISASPVAPPPLRRVPRAVHTGAPVQPNPLPSARSCASQCAGSVNCLLACGTSTDALVAPTPTREQVLMAMRNVRGAVLMCAATVDHAPSVATVNITFGSSGDATAVSVEPPFYGTVPGTCIERAVRRAHVPPFSRASFRVTYPYSW